MLYVKPEGYVDPIPSEPRILTPEERATVKTGMQDFLNTKTEPILLSVLLKKAHRQLTQNNIHVRRAVLKEIALEIQNEWGHYEYPQPIGTIEEEIPEV